MAVVAEQVWALGYSGKMSPGGGIIRAVIPVINTCLMRDKLLGTKMSQKHLTLRARQHPRNQQVSDMAERKF
jgi:hypothetical protein